MMEENKRNKGMDDSKEKGWATIIENGTTKDVPVANDELVGYVSMYNIRTML